MNLIYGLFFLLVISFVESDDQGKFNFVKGVQLRSPIPLAARSFRNSDIDKSAASSEASSSEGIEIKKADEKVIIKKGHGTSDKKGIETDDKGESEIEDKKGSQHKHKTATPTQKVQVAARRFHSPQSKEEEEQDEPEYRKKTKPDAVKEEENNSGEDDEDIPEARKRKQGKQKMFVSVENDFESDESGEENNQQQPRSRVQKICYRIYSFINRIIKFFMNIFGGVFKIFRN